MHATHEVSRRHFLATASLAAAAVCLPLRVLRAEKTSPVITIRNAAATAKINVSKLRGNLSVIEGSGGNITVLNTPDGKLLVEAGIPSSRPGITKALASVGDAPVKQLINTHWHFDHTDGNEWLHALGAEIIAHENTRKRMSTSTRVEGWDFTFPPRPEGALPTKVVGAEETLDFNGTSIALKYYGPAHTDSDLSVYFADADVLCTGDTLWNPHYPFIDYSTGGSIDGHIQAAAANVARVTDKTIVVPGHGKVGGKADLVAFHDMLVETREKVAALKKQGRSLEQIVAAKPTAKYDEKFGGFVIDGKGFTGLVYAGV